MAQQNVHASEAEIATWKKAAELAQMSFNGWLRRALTDRADLEFALDRERRRREEVRRPTL